jgi:NAD-dependent SIR2 family protein deacetylase
MPTNLQGKESGAKPEHHDVPDCQCAFCRDNLPVALPDDLIEACTSQNLVVFAGAGVSTESRRVLPYTLLDEIRAELPAEFSAREFPDVLQEFCDRFGRPALLRRIRARFKYVRSFPELYGQATRFHDELSTIYPLVDLVTTNWDTAFEDRCGATPIVSATDYAFWDEPGRKVFKLHGSIASWSSVVATRKDYDEVVKEMRTGVIGASLRHLLATKRVLFAGYSLRDSDFQEIYGLLRAEMGDVLPRSFVVTLDPEISEATTPDATIVRIDATYFMATLKERLVAEGVMLPDDIFAAAMTALLLIREEHRTLSDLNFQEYPSAIYSLVYQDGLKHALERALTLRNTGEYSHICNLLNAEDTYEAKQREKRRGRNYGDVAYLEGYLNGLRFLLVNDDGREHLPLYFVFGFDGELQTLDEFLEVLPDAKDLHKSSYRLACRQVKGYGENIVFHHFPVL